MEDKIMNLKISSDLMFAYLEKHKEYDQLLKNEKDDKYIISLVYSETNEENIDVFRVSEIKDPELRQRTFLLDQGYPVVHSIDNKVFIFSYLSEVKEFTESVGNSVRDQLVRLKI